MSDESENAIEFKASEATREVLPTATAPFWGAVASLVRVFPVHPDDSRTQRHKRGQIKRLIFGVGVLIVLAGYAHWGFLMAGVLVLGASALLPLTPEQSSRTIRGLERRRWRGETTWHDRKLVHDGRRLLLYDDQEEMMCRVLTNRSFKAFLQEEGEAHTYLEVRPQGSRKKSEAIGMVIEKSPQVVHELSGIEVQPGLTRMAQNIAQIQDVQDAHLEAFLRRMKSQ